MSMMDIKDIEKYSSAITLSDMEMFVYPELVYSLVLANIMSPILWTWRDEPSFKKLEGKSSYRKLMRLRQYVMDEFDFNLDLETWGLTNQATELRRFQHILSAEQIAASNALFGYTGDKYYFDVDIRKHFGLDRYDSETIPYWKTETIEAMHAFRRKAGYSRAAGECVSLATLYAAAAFIVCGVPLEDIFLILTPLHSQNFLDLNDGILTNNRRLVTKTMWFNGTEISYKAQRALRHERVTVVTHNSGYIHCLYDDATIDPKAYDRFADRLADYLSTSLDLTTFASFLRCHTQYQKHFQICRDCHGQPQFLKAETLYSYEHGSPYKIGDTTHEKLLEEVSDEDFVRNEIPGRVRCDRLCEFLAQRKPDVQTAEGRDAIRGFLQPTVPQAQELVERLADFVHIEAKLPNRERHFIATEPIELSVDQSRDRIIEYLRSRRSKDPTVDLAFYAYRDMASCDWRPFVKAAVERNPVSLDQAKGLSYRQVHRWLMEMPAESIYDAQRLAQPDEVANYDTGDGLEKAFLLANVIHHTDPDEELHLEVDGNGVVLRRNTLDTFEFPSAKALQAQVDIQPGGSIVVASGEPLPKG
jgi:hypothetical protein